MSQLPDPLDRLLANVPAPATPPWFAARTLARLRHERAKRTSWFWLRWALPASAVATLALWLTLSPASPVSSHPNPTPIADTPPVGTIDGDLVTALETFVAYLEERDQWPLELAGSPQPSW